VRGMIPPTGSIQVSPCDGQESTAAIRPLQSAVKRRWSTARRKKVEILIGIDLIHRSHRDDDELASLNEINFPLLLQTLQGSLNRAKRLLEINRNVCGGAVNHAIEVGMVFHSYPSRVCLGRYWSEQCRKRNFRSHLPKATRYTSTLISALPMDT